MNPSFLNTQIHLLPHGVIFHFCFRAIIWAAFLLKMEFKKPQRHMLRKAQTKSKTYMLDSALNFQGRTAWQENVKLFEHVKNGYSLFHTDEASTKALWAGGVPFW